MAIRIYKPTSPGRRHSSVSDFSDITKHEPEKSLVVTKKRTAGRNNQGKITVRHRGGGAKRYYRIIDFKRNRLDEAGAVRAIEYDPNRSARIALIEYPDGKKTYIIAPVDLKVGDEILTSQSSIEVKPGNRMPLQHIPVGMMIHGLELQPGRGAQIVRSAGLGARLMAIEENVAHIKLPSGEVRLFPGGCMATIGQVGNQDHRNVRYGKAGRMRLRGWRPTVRGKAMNPVDHAHGGGEGHNPIGLKSPKTYTGKRAMGVRTRRKNKWSNKFIVKRRAKK
jgi:large subunit ribosomal protein L2